MPTLGQLRRQDTDRFYDEGRLLVYAIARPDLVAEWFDPSTFVRNPHRDIAEELVKSQDLAEVARRLDDRTPDEWSGQKAVVGVYFADLCEKAALLDSPFVDCAAEVDALRANLTESWF
jgi:hypothetical protein